MRSGPILASALVVAVVALAITAGRLEPVVHVEGPWSRPLQERREDPFPRTFPNAAGDPITISGQPSRVVGASVLAAEVLLAICPPDRIAALHALAADPRYCAVAADVAAFPRKTSGGAEELLAQRPDLVITDPYTRAETQILLEQTGVVVLRTQPFSDLNQVADNLRLIGYALGLDAEAEALVMEMNEGIATAAQDRERRAAWRLLSVDQALYTFGSRSTPDDLLQRIGARNVAAEHGVGPYARLSLEQVLSWQPDALIIGAVPGTEDEERARILRNPGLQVLPCVQRGRLLFVPSALIASTSHHLAAAAGHIAATLDRWGPP